MAGWWQAMNADLCALMTVWWQAMKAREAGVAYFRTGSRGHTSAQAEGGGEMEMNATTGGGGGGSKLLGAAGREGRTESEVVVVHESALAMLLHPMTTMARATLLS